MPEKDKDDGLGRRRRQEGDLVARRTARTPEHAGLRQLCLFTLALVPRIHKALSRSVVNQSVPIICVASSGWLEGRRAAHVPHLAAVLRPPVAVLQVAVLELTAPDRGTWTGVVRARMQRQSRGHR